MPMWLSTVECDIPRPFHANCGADDSIGTNDILREDRKRLMAGAVEKLKARIDRDGTEEMKRTRKGMGAATAATGMLWSLRDLWKGV